MRVPGEAGEGVRGGGSEGWKLRNVSLFDLRGGVCWFNCFLSPLETQLGRFGVRNSTCVLEKQGGEKAGGVQYEFPRGCSAGTSFLLLASFSSCFFGLGLPGLLATFLLVFLDMFPSVSTYKVKGSYP